MATMGRMNSTLSNAWLHGAIARIEALPVVTGKVTRIRLEELGKS